MRKGLLSSTLIILIIFSIVTVSINITPAYGVPITPVISNSNTQESTPNTTLTNTDVVITAANLESGKKYVILYSAAYGGASTTDVIEVAVDFGGTVIAKSSDDGSSSGTPESMRIHNMAGYYVLTGDGTSDLRIQFRVITGTTAFITGKSLIAIPLEDLIEDTDYWFVQQNGDTAEATATNTWVNVLSTTPNLPETGNYLVLASMEGRIPSGGAATDGEAMRFQVDSTTQKREWAKEWETNNARRSFSYAELLNLTSGSHTFTLQGGTAQGTVTKEYSRGRILIFKASSFDQLVSADTDTDTTTLANHPTFDNFLTNNYTPNFQEYVVVIGNTFAWEGQNFRSVVMRIRDNTGGVNYSDFSSDDAKDIAIDRVTLTGFGAKQISSTNEFLMQIAGESSFTTAHHFQYGDLIVWSMFVPTQFTENPAETFTLTDTIDISIDIPRNLLDTLTLTDTQEILVNRGVTISDTVTLTDETVKETDKVTSETLVLTDTPVREHTRILSETESNQYQIP